MKAFRFPLDRVLQWRTLQCELEQAAGTRLATQRVQLAAQLAGIVRSRKDATDSISKQTEVASGEFQTLAHFHDWAEQQRTKLQARAQTLDKEIEAQLVRTLESRRKKKLLEMLRDGRLKDWNARRDAEDDQAAADAWLCRYAAERYTTENVSPPSG